MPSSKIEVAKLTADLARVTAERDARLSPEQIAEVIRLVSADSFAARMEALRILDGKGWVMDDSKEGWQTTKRNEQRVYHYIRDTFSLCRKLGFYSDELM